MDTITPQKRFTATASKHTSTSNNLNLTFGLEHEFLVLDSQRLDYKNQQKAAYGLSLVSEALQSPLQVTCSACGLVHDSDLSPLVQHKANDNSDHSHWNLVVDTSIKLNTRQNADLRENECEAYGVELTSRVLSADQNKPTTKPTAQARHVHTATYQEEISRFITNMNQLFTPQGPTVGSRQERRVAVNDSCSLHVHIGNGTAGFELQTVKNLLSICTAFERVMDSMHAKSRIGCSGLAFSSLDDDIFEDNADIMTVTKDGKLFGGYNRSLTERMYSNAYVTRRNDKQTSLLEEAASGYHTMAFFDVIQQASDIESLQQLMSLCCETNVNILHLVVNEGENVNEERNYRRLNTIEFRQHAAVTNPKDALAWIDFLQTLVKYAHSQSAECIRSTCESVASDPGFDLAAMFRLLGVEQETQHFYLSRSKESIQAAFGLARAEAETLNSDDPFRAILLELINERAADHDPENVANTIKEKFAQGGYGQFTREFIDAYAPHLCDEVKESLTIGWVMLASKDFGSEDGADHMLIVDDDELVENDELLA